MRVDLAGARTWLLAVVAGWALLVWVLGLMGMGSHVGKLDDDASLAERLPSPPRAVPERVGPLSQYGEIAARPVFSTDRRPQPFVLQQDNDPNAEQQQFDFMLTSVLLAPNVQVAIVQPTAGGESVRMKLGEAPEEAHGWRLVSLQPRSATFEGPQGQKTLELRTFDGTGGQAPTAATRPPVERPGPAAPVPPPAPATNTPATTPATTQRPTAATATGPAAAPSPTPTTPEEQMEAIRKRIEARRAQLRAEAQRNQNQQPQQPVKP